MAFTGLIGGADSLLGQVELAYQPTNLRSGLSVGSTFTLIPAAAAGVAVGSSFSAVQGLSAGVGVGSVFKETPRLSAGVTVGSTFDLATVHVDVTAGFNVHSQFAGDSGELANGRYRR